MHNCLVDHFLFRILLTCTTLLCYESQHQPISLVFLAVLPRKPSLLVGKRLQEVCRAHCVHGCGQTPNRMWRVILGPNDQPASYFLFSASEDRSICFSFGLRRFASPSAIIAACFASFSVATRSSTRSTFSAAYASNIRLCIAWSCCFRTMSVSRTPRSHLARI